MHFTDFARISLCLLIASVFLASTGCYQDPIRAKLIGTWKIEHGEKLTKRVNQIDGDVEEIEDLGERMKLSFYASGALQTKTRMGEVNREKNGLWKVIEFDEEEAVMKISCELMGQQTEHEVRFIEKDLIRLVPPNMAGTKSKLSFRRE
ncbi:hypothetical protein [Mariniblastus fucicola]|uniref:Lipocalin-like domain-containing protein n=1 Tax=Mariniblastus fucicola TaxID=980251 RepID=A0A5B9PDW2_9BACT|nr:hypothetical protein [Mariniblastus fucicola]QEG24474.1 hypothetical protein MFFC18_43940 [Mariniblastus fucicola]